MIDNKNELWIFGYGSLLWRPGFAYDWKHRATLIGWKRGLWQGSPDHRGTPELPGRVVTILPDEALATTGILYRVAAKNRNETIAYLDERESGGYLRLWIRMMLPTGLSIKALTYTALEGNPNFLGVTSQASLLNQIEQAVGESGENIEYCRLLRRSLNELKIDSNEISELFGKPDAYS